LPAKEKKVMDIILDDDLLKLTRLELGPYGTNAYVVVCKKTGSSLLVDAPAEAEKLAAALAGTKPNSIVITHRHFDHTEALVEVKAKLGLPVAVHPRDAAGLPCPVEIKLQDGDTLAVGELNIAILHTPGHTAGSICLHFGNCLLAGDTIFPGGPGHTDTPTAFTRIVESITQRIFSLADDTLICPGHGGSTVLGKEKEEFAVFASRRHRPDLHGDVLWLSP
jgi:hydroxyacylglutathione hydrolase